MKKVLVVTHYFWPENFKINSICIKLIERGYDVSVLTGKPNYPVGSFNRGYNFFNKNTVRVSKNRHRTPEWPPRFWPPSDTSHSKSWKITPGVPPTPPDLATV